MDRCHAWIRTPSSRFINTDPRRLQYVTEVNLTPSGTGTRPRIWSLMMAVHIIILTSLLATNASGALVSKRTHPFDQLSGSSRIALDSSVTIMFVVGTFMYFLANCTLSLCCLVFIEGLLMGEMFFPFHKELCYGWIFAHFSNLQHQITLHCFLLDWHSLLK